MAEQRRKVQRCGIAPNQLRDGTSLMAAQNVQTEIQKRKRSITHANHLRSIPNDQLEFLARCVRSELRRRANERLTRKEFPNRIKGDSPDFNIGLTPALPYQITTPKALREQDMRASAKLGHSVPRERCSAAE
jgi:hypothetical protein